MVDQSGARYWNWGIMMNFLMNAKESRRGSLGKKKSYSANLSMKNLYNRMDTRLRYSYGFDDGFESSIVVCDTASSAIQYIHTEAKSNIIRLNRHRY
jgi:hypothetical protein